MKYLFYSFLFASLYVYLGAGLTFLLTPRNLRKYALFLSPMVGYSYLTLVGWYFYLLDFGGTDVYGWIICLPPAIFLFAAFMKYRGQSNVFRPASAVELVAPVVAGIAFFLLVSLPFITDSNGLTAVSAGNLDIANYSSISTYVKETSRSSTFGLLEQLGPGVGSFRWHIESSVFGAFIYTAFPSSLFGLETYQLQDIGVAVFFIFGALLVYALARMEFGYKKYPGIAVMALYGLSPVMYYSAYQGFQSQIIAIGLTLGLFLLQLHAIDNCKKAFDFLAYIPLVVLFNLAISLTYPHMLIFIYAPLIVYAFFISLYGKSLSLLRWITFVLASLSATLALSPHRAWTLVSSLLFMGGVEAGWFMPWFSPDTILGLTLKVINLIIPPYNEFIRTSLSIPLSLLIVIIMLFGLLAAYKTSRKIFILAGSFLLVMVSGYELLSYMGQTDAGWGGYKSFKFLSFFLPLLLLSSLIWFRNARLTFARGTGILSSVILALLVGVNIFSALHSTNVMSAHYKDVSPDTADLKKIEGNPEVASINILGRDAWNIMWEANFLLWKQLYMEAPSYYPAASLDGEWDLVQCSPAAVDGSTVIPDGIIPVNSTYVLRRAGLFAEDSILPDEGFRAELSTSNDIFTTAINRNSTVTVPTKIKNLSNSVWPGKCVSGSKYPIIVGYRWLDMSGEVSQGKSVFLPYDLNPGDQVTLDAVITTPDKPGQYTLELDMIQEQVAWFKAKGSNAAQVAIKIE